MNKREIEKNRLDLSYKRNLQLLNVILLIGGGSFVAYLAGLILNPEKAFEYTILLVILGIITYVLYNLIDNILKGISNKIKKLVGN